MKDPRKSDIAKHPFKPNCIDVMKAITAIVAGRTNHPPFRVPRLAIHKQLIKQSGRQSDEAMRRELLKVYNNVSSLTICNGGLLYEEISHHTTVPANAAAFADDITVDEVVNDPNPQKYLTRGRGKRTAGFFFCPKDDPTFLAVEHLNRQKDVTLGKKRQLHNRLGNISSDPRVGLLEKESNRYDNALQLAMPETSTKE